MLTTFASNDGNVPIRLALLIHTAVSADNFDRKAGTCCRVKLLAPDREAIALVIRRLVVTVSDGQ